METVLSWTTEKRYTDNVVWTRNVLGVPRRAMLEALLLGMIDSIGGGNETV
jgi:hypothetical protein